jgi:carbamoyltransferase
MNVLGISAYYHDSAACLIKNGNVVAAAHQERFSRKKHDLGFPTDAITYCLREGNITLEDVDVVAFYEKPYLKFERLLFQFVDTFPRSLPVFVESIPSWLSEKLLVKQNIKQLGYNGKIVYLEHHLSHATSSFLCSPFDTAAILTMDGVGEYATTTFSHGKKNAVDIIKEIRFPHSLGLLYSTITAYLGFSVNNSEYKVMGLAPTGKPEFKREFDQLIHLFEDGSFALNMDYFAFTYKKKMFTPKLERLFGQLSRTPESAVTEFHQNIAASLQEKTEEVLFNALNALHVETGEENLCMAGGVALNSVANGKILKETPFKKIFIQPAAGDAGTAMGAALYGYNSINQQPRTYRFNSAFLGPQYSDKNIETYLTQNNIVYTRLKDESTVAQRTAQLIFKNKVIGWFQGRMEWGPRALGARSILSNPTNPDMKDILNQKVKHREQFRPFAPVILVEETHKWFVCDNPVPEPADYMLMVYPIRPKKQALIPAVTHVDGSGRLQTIRRQQHPLYYDTIKQFEKLSGVPILINTSFNIRGEPIVCTPHDAYRCMMGTGIDYLVMGHYLIARADNLQDQWNSEEQARD